MRLSDDGTFVLCDKCNNKIKNHVWGRIKAKGWFFSKDNKTARCPDHVPDWYSKWPKRKA